MENQLQILNSKNEISTNGAWEGGEIFEKTCKVADMLSKTSLIPKQYQGNPANCFIAVDMANRMGVSPMMVMQNLYVVNGKPSWSGQACMTFIKASPEFRNIKINYTKSENGIIGCYISAERVSDGQQVVGEHITQTMAQAEGWTSNKKWINMPKQMLTYRAAAFFARAFCPEVLMGVRVEGEAEDITADQKPCTTLTNALKGANNAE